MLLERVLPVILSDDLPYFEYIKKNPNTKNNFSFFFCSLNLCS